MSSSAPSQSSSPGEQILLRLLIKNTDTLERMGKVLEQQIFYINLLLFPNGNDPRVTTEQQESNNTSQEHQEGIKEPDSRIQVTNSKSVTKKD